MFGGSYFGKVYYGGTYFGPNVEIIIVSRPSKPDSVSGHDGFTVRKLKIPLKEYEENDKLIDQLVREDEEIIHIIIKAFEAGIIK